MHYSAIKFRNVFQDLNINYKHLRIKMAKFCGKEINSEDFFGVQFMILGISRQCT